jgi:hypothetical protein
MARARNGRGGRRGRGGRGAAVIAGPMDALLRGPAAAPAVPAAVLLRRARFNIGQAVCFHDSAGAMAYAGEGDQRHLSAAAIYLFLTLTLSLSHSICL